MKLEVHWNETVTVGIWKVARKERGEGVSRVDCC